MGDIFGMAWKRADEYIREYVKNVGPFRAL